MPAGANPIETAAALAAGVDLPAAWAGDGGGVPHLIAVRACGAAWRVHGEPLEDILFTSGAAAERAARRLALAIARSGADAKVNVYDAGDALVASIACFAVSDPPAPDVQRQYPWGD